MVDVHCHLNFKAFENDYDEVIKRAFEAGVTKIINVGTQISSSERAVELAQKYENLYAIVGVHPHHADKVTISHLGAQAIGFPDDEGIATSGDTGRHLPPRNDRKGDWLEQLEQLAKHPKVVAIGEIGMDNYRYQSNGIVDLPLQKEIFEKQIGLAHRLQLPLQIHNRHAGKEILEILLHHKSYLLNPPGMFHCMSGNVEILKKVLDMGFYVGFDGNITYEGLAPGEDTDLKDLVKATPTDRIVIETDSPYLTPVPHRGERNEPKNAIIVGTFIASLKDISYQALVEATTQNVHNLFGV